MQFQAPVVLALATAATASLVTRQESAINKDDIPYRCRSVCKSFLKDVKKYTWYYGAVYAPFSDDTDFTNYICGDQDILDDLQYCYDCTSSTRKYSDSGGEL
ncbi:hypothetical protein DOTSEDRAFT_36233 [Dothistroma septosporum NZE10]|uniref:Uncharacterized protein n=1 Tax=Dothistroma septosporum (strain NZE10 / CBS 128990) TaxID=675120 RepID=N1PIY1_DOTSN|nr:hypothetical protein DOTSEDRAFT_36233 [Dothistroma septosporum NZE10]